MITDVPEATSPVPEESLNQNASHLRNIFAGEDTVFNSLRANSAFHLNKVRDLDHLDD